MKTKIEDVNTGRNEIKISTIKDLPSVTGEPNVLKSLQLLPGIQAANEGLSKLYVRGGNYDQNLIVLDEAPVYNPTHALGFFSTFNSDAIKKVEVYKGAFPAQYGGRLSSVINITMREGNYNKTQVKAAIGLLASRLNIEAPIVKGKASFMLSGRYSYAGSTLNLIGGKVGNKMLGIPALNNFNDQNDISFYDFNAKLNYKINENNHLYFSTYTGHDKFYCYPLNNENELEWGNLTNTLRWNHIFSGKLFSNLTAYYSQYNYNSTIKEDIRHYNWKANIQEAGLKYDLTFYANQNNNIKTGISGTYHYVKPGSIKPKDAVSIIEPFALDNKYATGLNAYVSNEQTMNHRLVWSYGLRYTAFMNYGAAKVYNYDPLMETILDSTTYAKGEMINYYQGLEPRLSVRFKLNKANTVKLAYAYTKQYLHLLSNSSAGLPSDIWIPADRHIKPQSSHQYVLGYYRAIEQKMDLSIETYYKQLNNVLDYVDNADLFMNQTIETQIRQGNAWSSGIELLLKKDADNFTGWISYTWAKTQYKITGVNNSKSYAPRHDIRHNFTAVANYKLNDRWSFSSSFKLSSGGFITTPTQTFTIDDAAFFDYPQRNNYKLPLYHRLDISTRHKGKKNENRKRYKSSWVFAINNIYNHKNIFAIYMKQNPYDLKDVQAYKLYLYGIVPSISYNIAF